MSDPVLTTALILGATLPTGAIAWAAGRVGERLTASPRLRHALWTGTTALGLVAAAAAPVWSWLPARKMAAPVARHVADTSTRTLPVALLAHTPPPPWASLMQPLALGLVGVAAAGAALAMALLAVRMVRLHGFAARATPAGADIQRFVVTRALALGVTPPKVMVSREISTAVLTGFRQPTILLPSGLMETMRLEELQLICAHELAHLRRGDHLRAPAERALAALLWFNPFVLGSLARTSAAREAVCDAVALEGSAPAERRLYAEALVTALRLSSTDATQPAFIRRKGTGHAMRLKAILHPPAKAGPKAVITATGLGLLAAFSTFAVSDAFARQVDDAGMQAKIATSRAKYHGATALDYQRYCASKDLNENAYCAGVMFALLRGPNVCLPKDLDVASAQKKAVPAVAATSPLPNEKAAYFARRVVQKTYPCALGAQHGKNGLMGEFDGVAVSDDKVTVHYDGSAVLAAEEKAAARQTSSQGNYHASIIITSDVKDIKSYMLKEGRREQATAVYTGSPTIKLWSDTNYFIVKLNGQVQPAGFNADTVPPGTIERIEVAAKGSPEARLQGAEPGQSVVNIITKPR